MERMRRVEEGYSLPIAMYRPKPIRYRTETSIYSWFTQSFLNFFLN